MLFKMHLMDVESFKPKVELAPLVKAVLCTKMMVTSGAQDMGPHAHSPAKKKISFTRHIFKALLY